jgi:hypothetical protein
LPGETEPKKLAGIYTTGDLLAALKDGP